MEQPTAEAGSPRRREPASAVAGCKEYELTGRRELAVYAAAVVTYIPLGMWLRTPILNWVVGPLWFVAFAWAGAVLVGRRTR